MQHNYSISYKHIFGKGENQRKPEVVRFSVCYFLKSTKSIKSICKSCRNKEKIKKNTNKLKKSLHE